MSEKLEVLAKESKLESRQKVAVDGWVVTDSGRVRDPTLYSSRTNLSVAYMQGNDIGVIVQFFPDKDPVLLTGTIVADVGKPTEEDLKIARAIVDYFVQGLKDKAFSFPDTDSQYPSEARRVTEELVDKLNRVVPT